MSIDAGKARKLGMPRARNEALAMCMSVRLTRESVETLAALSPESILNPDERSPSADPTHVSIHSAMVSVARMGIRGVRFSGMIISDQDVTLGDGYHAIARRLGRLNLPAGTKIEVCQISTN